MSEKMPHPTELHAKMNKETGEMECEAIYEPSEPTRILAQLAVDLLKVEEAPNFFTFEVTAPDDIRISITIQRMKYDADTPAAKLARMGKEIADLKKQLAEATPPQGSGESR